MSYDGFVIHISNIITRTSLEVFKIFDCKQKIKISPCIPITKDILCYWKVFIFGFNRNICILIKLACEQPFYNLLHNIYSNQNNILVSLVSDWIIRVRYLFFNDFQVSTHTVPTFPRCTKNARNEHFL